MKTKTRSTICNPWLVLGLGIAVGMAMLLLGSQPAWAGTVKIGNSDEGGDLEKLEKHETGDIKASQIAAVLLLESLNVRGIAGLGSLVPEVKDTELYMAESDVRAAAKDDFRADHLSSDGMVYARTVAEPRASTNFFPISLLLSREQQVKLHIHEGLHRALPAEVREDETIVSQLTLAIADPKASFDSVSSVAAKVIPKPDPYAISFREDLYPSLISYSLRQYRGADSSGSAFEVNRAHSLKSYMYPFGSDENTFGLGLDFSILERKGDVASGPIGFSFRWKAVTKRKFDVDFFGSVSLNTLSFQELKNSPYGRDVYEIGLSLRRQLKFFYVENSVNIRNGGRAVQQLGLIKTIYEYGNIVEPSVHFGLLQGPWHVGAFFNFFLASGFSVHSDSFVDDIGRFRVVTIGPEINYHASDFSLFARGSYLLNSTKDADLANLGLLGTGVGKGWIELGARFQY